MIQESVDEVTEEQYMPKEDELVTPTESIMSVVYSQAQKQRYRITLELDVLGDFDPHQISWEDIFDLGGDEQVEAYVEDLSVPVRW